MARSQARKQTLLDIFTTAMEGGIGYWSICLQYRWQLPDDGGEDLDGFHAIVVADEDWEEAVDDAQDAVPASRESGRPKRSEVRALLQERGQEHRIDANVIARGLNRLAKGDCTWGGKPMDRAGPCCALARLINRSPDDADYDADDVDNIVQAGLFGDVRYG